MAFQDPSVINAADFVLAMQANYPTLGLIGNISFFIILIDLIVLLAKKERLRSLHDIIANTYVLKDLSNSENKTVANNI